MAKDINELIKKYPPERQAEIDGRVDELLKEPKTPEAEPQEKGGRA